MKAIILIFLVSSLSCYSQKHIKIDFVFRDACADSVKILSYSMMYMYEDLKVFKSNGRNATLDSAGVYLLYLDIKKGGTVLAYDFMKYYDTGKEYIDTLVIPKLLYEVPALHSNIYYYYYCDSLADGEIVEYYPNGKKRCSGYFSKGLAEGNLDFFDIRGKLIKRIIYDDGVMGDSFHYYRRRKTFSY